MGTERMHKDFSQEFLAAFQQYCLCEKAKETPSKQIMIDVISGCLETFPNDVRAKYYPETTKYVASLRTKNTSSYSLLHGIFSPSMHKSKVMDEVSCNSRSSIGHKKAAKILAHCLRYYNSDDLTRIEDARPNTYSHIWETLKKEVLQLLQQQQPSRQPVENYWQRLTAAGQD